jgi:hypothetical protein
VDGGRGLTLAFDRAVPPTARIRMRSALWGRRQEGPTCRDEALSVLKACSQQSDSELDDVLSPHAAAVANLLLDRDAR